MDFWQEITKTIKICSLRGSSTIEIKVSRCFGTPVFIRSILMNSTCSFPFLFIKIQSQLIRITVKGLQPRRAEVLELIKFKNKIEFSAKVCIALQSSCPFSLICISVSIQGLEHSIN